MPASGDRRRRPQIMLRPPPLQPEVAAADVHNGLRHVAARCFQAEGCAGVRKLVQRADIAAPRRRVVDGRQPGGCQRRAAAARQQQAGCAQAGCPAASSVSPVAGLVHCILWCSGAGGGGSARCGSGARGGGGRAGCLMPPRGPLPLPQGAPYGSVMARTGCLLHYGVRWRLGGWAEQGCDGGAPGGAAPLRLQ